MIATRIGRKANIIIVNDSCIVVEAKELLISRNELVIEAPAKRSTTTVITKLRNPSIKYITRYFIVNSPLY